MREVELKAVVTDPDAAQQSLTAAGGTLKFEGALNDRRYDTPAGDLALEDEVIRVRRYRGAKSERTLLDWKGPADTRSGYKVREELSTEVADEKTLVAMLEKLGYVVVHEIDRRIVQYELAGAIVRLEIYPRMDALVEVEGGPEAIEGAIAALGMKRGEFTSESLPAFVARFERRTGVRAAVSERELAGEY